MSSDTPNFHGLRVAAFESRRAEEMSRMIAKLGGIPSVSPSLREVPLETNPDAVDFAYHLISGQIDIVILMTGVGLRHLVAQIERQVPRERFLAARGSMAGEIWIADDFDFSDRELDEMGV